MLNQTEITAHIEIPQVLYRYCRAVDRGDLALLKSVYHDGATDSHGAWSGSGEAFAQQIVGSMNENGNVSMHHITNILIEVKDDVALVESYFLAQHPYQDDTNNQHLANVGGRYLDRFEYRHSEWRIATRQVVLDWTRADISGEQWLSQTKFPNGARGAADPSTGHFSN